MDPLSQIEFDTLIELLNRVPMTTGELLASNYIMEKLKPPAPPSTPAGSSPADGGTPEDADVPDA